MKENAFLSNNIGLKMVNDTQGDEIVYAQSFWKNIERVEIGAQIRRQGRLVTAEKIGVVSGWLCEYTLLPDGRRQIFDFVLPNEIASFSTSDCARRDLVALTRVELVDWAAARPEMRERVVQSWERSEPQRQSRMFDQVIRLGRLSAQERMLNLFLDIYHRLRKAGLVQADTLKLPLTQELLADALGLSVVHINRTVKALRAKGYITLRSGMITLHRPDELAELACYEHLPNPVAAPSREPVWAMAN
jgi:CRP-like cAMP-binding protein